MLPACFEKAFGRPLEGMFDNLEGIPYFCTQTVQPRTCVSAWFDLHGQREGKRSKRLGQQRDMTTRNLEDLARRGLAQLTDIVRRQAKKKRLDVLIFVISISPCGIVGEDLKQPIATIPGSRSCCFGQGLQEGGKPGKGGQHGLGSNNPTTFRAQQLSLDEVHIRSGWQPSS